MTTLYLETYSTRISDTYTSLRHKAIALAYFWRFVHESCTEVKTCAGVLPTHARAYIPHALERARQVQRGALGRRPNQRLMLGYSTFERSLLISANGQQSRTRPSNGLHRVSSLYSGTTCAAIGFEKARIQAS